MCIGNVSCWSRYWDKRSAHWWYCKVSEKKQISFLRKMLSLWWSWVGFSIPSLLNIAVSVGCVWLFIGSLLLLNTGTFVLSIEIHKILLVVVVVNPYWHGLLLYQKSTGGCENSYRGKVRNSILLKIKYERLTPYYYSKILTFEKN